MGLDRDILPEGEMRVSVLGVLAVGLAFFRAVDATESDAFRVLAVQDFDRVSSRTESTGPEKSAKESVVGMRISKRATDNNNWVGMDDLQGIIYSLIRMSKK